MIETTLLITPSFRILAAWGSSASGTCDNSPPFIGRTLPELFESALKNENTGAQTSVIMESCRKTFASGHASEVFVDGYPSPILTLNDTANGVTSYPCRIRHIPLHLGIGQVGWVLHQVSTLEPPPVARDLQYPKPSSTVELASNDAILAQVLNANEDQRRLMAKALHDNFGQNLTALMIGLQALEAAHPQSAGSIGLLRRLTDELGTEARRLTGELRPAALDDIGLQAALLNFVEDWSEKHNIPVDLQLSGLEDRRFPGYLETASFRIVQEALSNVAKHARASKVGVIGQLQGKILQLVVEDDGRGFDESSLRVSGPRRGRGLPGMRERARLAGGSLELETSPGAGCAVLVRLPCVAESIFHV